MNDNDPTIPDGDPVSTTERRAIVRLSTAYMAHVADLRARTRRRLRELGLVPAIADAIVEGEDCEGLRAIADDVGVGLSKF